MCNHGATLLPFAEAEQWCTPMGDMRHLTRQTSPQAVLTAVRVLEADISDLRRAARAATDRAFQLQTAAVTNIIRVETSALVAADSAEYLE
eukprot:2894446-Rhodomonas_salina.2